MSSSERAFRVGLYEEYLDEAAFLYHQRAALIADPKVPWTRLGDFEQRLHAHVDGLLVGQALALAVCRDHLEQGDAGELFAIACVATLSTDRRLFAEVLMTIRQQGPAQTTAVGDALRHTLPTDWHGLLGGAIGGQAPRHAGMLIDVAGYRRVPCGAAIIAEMLRSPEVAGVAASALGRLRDPNALSALRSLCLIGDPAIAPQALVALLRSGDHEAVARAASLLGSQAWVVIPYALAAGRTASAALRQVVQRGPGRAEAVLALGLLGNPEDITVLVTVLSDPDLAEAAATALFLLTGAPLIDEVFEAEEPNPDEWFGAEVAAYEADGTIPARGDGKPYGSSRQLLSRVPSRWIDWLTENRGRFEAGRRYRLGLPDAPEVAVAALRSEVLPKAVRAILCDEFVVRYGLDGGLESDQFVMVQNHLLRQMREADGADPRTSGRWRFAGLVI